MTNAHKVYLIRHGQTVWNHERRWQGLADVPLAETGLAQAQRLAWYMPRVLPLDAVYTSDLSRAAVTAEAVAKAYGLTPISEPLLRETHVGIFQGRTMSEIEVMYPDEIAAWRESQTEFVIPGGESRKMVADRAIEAFLAITEKHIHAAEPQHIALVTHGGWIGAFIQYYLKHDQNLLFGNTSITTLVKGHSGWRLESLNQTPHLD